MGIFLPRKLLLVANLALAFILLTASGSHLSLGSSFGVQSASSSSPNLSPASPSVDSGNVGKTPHATISYSSGIRSAGSNLASSATKSAPTSNGLSAGSGNNVVYHGGPTMHTSITYAIFWLPSGYSFDPLLGSSKYESLIIRFLKDVGGSSFYNILSQYTDSSSGSPLDVSIFGGAYIDTSPYPSNNLSALQVQNEVASDIPAAGWSQADNKIFFILTAYGIDSTSFVPHTAGTFVCGYHTYDPSNNVIYSDIADPNIVSLFTGEGCPPVLFSPNLDGAADRAIYTVSHELFEAVSDPQPTSGWNDNSTPPGLGEIGDKCENLFVAPNLFFADIYLNGDPYYIQEEWSNFAGGCTFSFGPSTSVVLDFNPATGVMPLSNSNTFNVSYFSEGLAWWTTTAYPTGSVPLYADPNSPITISSLSSGSYSGEKWCLNSSCSSAYVNSGSGRSVSFSYYDLLSQSVSLSTNDGNSSSAVSLTYFTAPSSAGSSDSVDGTSVVLSSTPQTIWVERATFATVPALAFSDSQERLLTSRPSWFVSSPDAIPNSIEYYHQYNVTFSSTVKGGGTGYLPPRVNYFSLGSELSVANVSAVWADASSLYFYPQALGGSNNQEQWAKNESDGTITSSGTITAHYFNQYPITINYSVIGGGSPEGLNLTFTIFGNSYEYTLNETLIQLVNSRGLFLDAGSFYAVTNSLQGSTSQERWFDSSAPSGHLTSPLALTAEFFHQYYLTITASSSVAGSVSFASGWYNSSQSVTLSASPNSGWFFQGWSGTGSGSYSGANNPVSIVVNGPLSEEALFTSQTSSSSSSTSVSSSSNAQSTSSASGIQTSTTTVPQAPPPGNASSTTTAVGNSAFSFSVAEEQVAFVVVAGIIGVILIAASILFFRRKNVESDF